MIIRKFETGEKRIIAYVTPTYNIDWDYVYNEKTCSCRRTTFRYPVHNKVIITNENKEKFNKNLIDISYFSLSFSNEDEHDTFQLNSDFQIKLDLNEDSYNNIILKGKISRSDKNRVVVLLTGETAGKEQLNDFILEQSKKIQYSLFDRRRSNPRFNYKEKCKLTSSSGHILEFKTRNFSLTGVSFTGITEELKPNASVEMIFNFSDELQDILINGTVIWNQENLIGIKFNEELPEKDKVYLHLIKQTKSHGLNNQNMKNFLKQFIPEYMIPYVFVPLDKIPLTANGKVNRKELPDPIESLEDENKDKTITAPRNEIEKKVFAMWQDILKLKNISIFDNFFELGGDSLQVYQIAMRAEAEYNIKIPIDSLYKEPTIANVSEFIEQILANKGEISSTELLATDNREDQTENDTNIYY